MSRRMMHLYILLAVILTVILIALFSEPVAGWAQRLDGEGFGFTSGPYDVALLLGLCALTAVVIALMILRLNQSDVGNRSSSAAKSSLEKLETQFARGGSLDIG